MQIHSMALVSDNGVKGRGLLVENTEAGEKYKNSEMTNLHSFKDDANGRMGATTTNSHGIFLKDRLP